MALQHLGLFFLSNLLTLPMKNSQRAELLDDANAFRQGSMDPSNFHAVALECCISVDGNWLRKSGKKPCTLASKYRNRESYF